MKLLKYAINGIMVLSLSIGVVFTASASDLVQSACDNMCKGAIGGGYTGGTVGPGVSTTTTPTCNVNGGYCTMTWSTITYPCTCTPPIESTAMKEQRKKHTSHTNDTNNTNDTNDTNHLRDHLR